MTRKRKWTAALTAVLISIAAFCTCGTRVQDEIRNVKVVYRQGHIGGWPANAGTRTTGDGNVESAAAHLAFAGSAHHPRSRQAGKDGVDDSEFHAYDIAAAAEVSSSTHRRLGGSSDDEHL